MNILDKLGLAPSEQKILKRVAVISLCACVGVVILAWVVQTFMIQLSASADESTKAEGLAGKYAKSAGDLLSIDLEAHRLAADRYIRTNRPQQAVEHLLRIVSTGTDDRAVQLKLATAYLKSLQFSKARAILADLSKSDNQDSLSAPIEARRGLVLFHLGQVEESRDKLRECLDRYPRSAEAACYLAQVEASIDKSSQRAEALLLAAVSWDKDYAEGWYQLARYYMAHGQYEKSRTHLLRVLDIVPLHAKAHSRLGMAYYYLGQVDMAKRSYETALALNPRDFNTRYNLGELYYTAYKDTQKAAVEFRKALGYNTNHVEANFKLGLICLGNDMLRKAVSYLETARRHAPQNTRVLLQLGVAYERLQMKEKALEVYRTIADYDALNRIARQKIRLLTGS